MQKMNEGKMITIVNSFELIVIKKQSDKHTLTK